MNRRSWTRICFGLLFIFTELNNWKSFFVLKKNSFFAYLTCTLFIHNAIYTSEVIFFRFEKLLPGQMNHPKLPLCTNIWLNNKMNPSIRISEASHVSYTLTFIFFLEIIIKTYQNHGPLFNVDSLFRLNL